MSNIIWFPVPVATLFRRLVNVISTASIAHHYLLPSRSLPASDDSPEQHDFDPRSACRVLWENGSQGAGAVHASLKKTGEDSLDGFLKGTCATITLSVINLNAIAASGKLWPRWPTRLSLFHPGSRSAQQLAEPSITDVDDGRNSAPIPSPNRYPREQHENENENENRGGAIHRLMQSPVLYDPIRAPRFPIVLCHGTLRFCTQKKYSNRVRRVIRLRRPRPTELAHAVLVVHP
jgi:triacylglycerol lipase